MANRHDNEADEDEERRLPRLYRRRFLTAAGGGAFVGMLGLTGRSRAITHVVDLGAEGLSDGDNISPYIDQYWTDGAEVHIPAGSYRYDGSGLHGRRGDCALIGSEDGVEFRRPSDSSQVRPTIQCTHGTMRVENITVRGASPSSANTNGSRWRFDALDRDSRIEVVNVNHPDGSTNNSDSNAFLTYEDHYGTLHFKNCYVAGFGNSSFYTNLGYKSGERNSVIIENCTIIDANGSIRGGHNGSKYIDCTFVWRDKPSTWVNGSSLARGIRWDHGGRDELVENCHFYFGGDIGGAGGSLEFENYPLDGTVRDVYIHTEGSYGGIYDKGGMGGWSFENVNVTGPGSAAIDANVSVGNTPPDLRNENVVWMPESQTVRPGGVQRDGDSSEPSSVFEIVSTDSGAELDYSFVVDGDAWRADAGGGNSSVGESNDTVSDNGDGTVTVTGHTGFGFGDAFRVTGPISDFERTDGESSFQLVLDGEDVTDELAGGSDTEPEPEPSSVFEVVSTDSGAELTYAFDVEGSAEKADAGDGNSSVGEANDTITDNGDGTVTVEGKTGFGFGDAFTVTGAVSNFERTSGESSFQLVLDGEDVTDDLAGPQRVYVDGTAAPEQLNAYRIEVSGEIQPDPENTTLVDGGLEWDAMDDIVDGTTAVGVVGNGVDAYTYTGEIVDLTVEGDATSEVEN